MSRFAQVDWIYIKVRNLVIPAILVAACLLGAGVFSVLQARKARADASREIEVASHYLLEASAFVGLEGEVPGLYRQGETHLASARQALVAGDAGTALAHALQSQTLAKRVLALAHPQGAPQHPARFFRLEGKVMIRRAGSLTWSEASLLEPLHAGDSIKTSAQGAAEIIYEDGRMVAIAPESLLQIDVVAAGDAGQALHVTENLVNGALRLSPSETAHDEATHRIQTHSATLGGDAQSAEVSVAHDAASSTTRFDAHQGRARIEAGGRSTPLEGGTRVSVDATGEASPPTPFLPRPRLIAPEAAQDLRYVNPAETPTAFAWTPVEGASGYRLAGGRSSLLARVELARDRIADGFTQVRGLESGWWYWQVAALDATGEPGDPSVVGAFRVVKTRPVVDDDHEPPALTILETLQSGTLAIISGRTEPDASVSVAGRPVLPEEDGHFTAVVRVGGTGLRTLPIVVRDQSGNEAIYHQEIYIPGH